jgi:hypothetical protein
MTSEEHWEESSRCPAAELNGFIWLPYRPPASRGREQVHKPEAERAGEIS